jgi:outer membrane autotransporter protein
LAFRSGVAYTWNSIEANRSAAFSGFEHSLASHYHAGTAQVFSELGYGLKMDAITVEPFANLAYVHLHTNGFTESGGSAALSANDQGTDSTFSTLGLRLSGSFTIVGVTATTNGSAGWRHAFGDMTPNSELAFASASSTFTIAGVPIARNAAVIDVAISRNASVGVSYHGQFAPGSTDNSVRGNVSIRF